MPTRLTNKIQRLFWDTEVAPADYKKYADFVITRVAEKGGLNDIKWLVAEYGKSQIRRVVAGSRNVSAKTKNFWKVI